MNACSIRKHLWWLVPNELAGMPLPWVCDQRRKNPCVAADVFDDDVKFLAETGILSIVGALDIPIYRKIFQGAGFNYCALQIPDGCPPTLDQVESLLAFYNRVQRPLGVHCEGGVGRTGTLLAIILLHRGMSASAAIKAVKEVMPPALDNASQLAFLYRCEKHIIAKKQGK